MSRRHAASRLRRPHRLVGAGVAGRRLRRQHRQGLPERAAQPGPLAGRAPSQVGPAELDRQHIRGWLVEVRQRHSSNTTRGWFAGVRHFCRWLQSEGEADQDATAGIRTPAPGGSETPVLSDADLRALLGTCAGTDFTARRDAAIIVVFLDGGLRLSELASLQVADVDLRDRIVFVAGKASRRSGPRHRAVPLGVKAARALDRYLRERRPHPYADTPRLWLGSRGRPTLDADGVKAMLKRRAPTPASRTCTPMRSAIPGPTPSGPPGGTKGDLMLLGGVHPHPSGPRPRSASRRGHGRDGPPEQSRLRVLAPLAGNTIGPHRGPTRQRRGAMGS
jgi:integrase